MSASSIATLAPSDFNARAKLTAVVDLPTPPLPDATAIIFLTFAIIFTLFPQVIYAGETIIDCGISRLNYKFVLFCFIYI